YVDTRRKRTDAVSGDEMRSQRPGVARSGDAARKSACATVIFATILLGQEPADKLIAGSDCASCHAADRQIVGPAYRDVARRYAGQADAPEKIAAKIRDGGRGMTPHPDLNETQRRQIATWILSQRDAAIAQSETKQYDYTLKDGSTVKLD